MGLAYATAVVPMPSMATQATRWRASTPSYRNVSERGGVPAEVASVITTSAEHIVTTPEVRQVGKRE